MESVGERLKQLRLSVKKTLEETSKIFEVSLNSVYRWEHDLCVPRKSVLTKIADYFDVPFEWLLNGDRAGFRNRSTVSVVKDHKCGKYILNLEKNNISMLLTVKEMELLCAIHSGTISSTLDLLRKVKRHRNSSQESLQIINRLVEVLSVMNDGDTICLAFDPEKEDT